ncbi:beta-propeller domain-containing protein [Anaerobacillus sp. HL2]|nr:beta-propeller domain-containing protein [Anaerobacillus sp. HL2]
MYVDEDYLILIGMRPLHDTKNSIYKDFTQVKVYELNERSNLTLVREAEIEGYYSSSRKINDQLYLISNKHLPYYMFNEPHTRTEKEALMNDMKPTYRDTAISSETQVVDWDKMYYFPDSTESNYLIVAGMNLAKLETPVSVNTYLGAGNTIYATKEHLYVTRTHYEYNPSTMQKMAEIIFQPLQTVKHLFISLS